MPKLEVIDKSKKVVKSIQVSDEIFAAEVKETVVHQVVVAQLAGARAGTHSTKTRDEVRGGGKKPWKQKGTGSARAGSRRSPLWRGGAIIFGPKPRDYSKDVNKKMKRMALNSTLSSLISEKRLVIIDSLAMSNIKTKEAAGLLKKFDARLPALVIHGDGCENFVRSISNVADVKAMPAAGLNVYDLLCAEVVICTSDAIKTIEERLSK